MSAWATAHPTLREYPKTVDFSLFIFGNRLKYRVWTLRVFCEPFLNRANYEK